MIRWTQTETVKMAKTCLMIIMRTQGSDNSAHSDTHANKTPPGQILLFQIVL